MQSGFTKSDCMSWQELCLEYENEQRKSLPFQEPISSQLLRRINEALAKNGIKSISDVNILLLIKINFTSSSSNEPLKIARAFRAVEAYALNLFHRFWKKEYYRLKRYGGYFKTYVDAYLKGVDVIFHKMGYTLSDDETEWQMVGPTEKEWTKELAPTCISIAFYCCVAAVECEHVASVCSELGQRNTPANVFLHRLDNPATPRVTVQQLRQKIKTGTLEASASTAITDDGSRRIPATSVSSQRTELLSSSSVPAYAVPFPQSADMQKLEHQQSAPPAARNTIRHYDSAERKYYDTSAIMDTGLFSPPNADESRHLTALVSRVGSSGSSAFVGSGSPIASSPDIAARSPIHRHAAHIISGPPSAAGTTAESRASVSTRTSEYSRRDPIEMSEPLAAPQYLYTRGDSSDVRRVRKNALFDETRSARESVDRLSWEPEAATADEHMAISLQLLDDPHDNFPPPPKAFSGDYHDLTKPPRANDAFGRLGTADLRSAPRSSGTTALTTIAGEALPPDASDWSIGHVSIREPPPYSTTNAVGVSVPSLSTSSADTRSRVYSAASASRVSALPSDANKSAQFSLRGADVTASRSEAANECLVFNKIGP